MSCCHFLIITFHHHFIYSIHIILELEKLEKSDRYCYLLTTKGKKAESLYKSPDFFQMTIKSFFKTI